MKSMKAYALISLPLLLASCWGADTQTKPATPNTADTVKGLNQLADIAEKTDPSNPEDVAKMMEKYAEVGAGLEVKEFEKTQPVDAPENFPTEFLYKTGKITSASDNYNEGNVSQTVEIGTLDKSSDVRDSYKKILSSNGWKITNQTNDSGGGDYSASKTDGSSVRVSIDSNPYSKITSVQIEYLK